MDCFIHQTYGRMRVRVTSLKGDRTRSCELAAALSSMSGVNRVVVNEMTGNAVVHFDPDRLNPATILRLFQQQKLLPNVIGFPNTPSRQRQLFRDGHREIEDWVAQTFDRASRIIFRTLLETALQKTGRILLRKILP